MALAWCFHRAEVTSVIIGTSSVSQLKDNLETLNNLDFTDDERWRIGELSA
jgi:L-glyceraldehyde 3-phosphate reductase